MTKKCARQIYQQYCVDTIKLNLKQKYILKHYPDGGDTENR